MSLPQDLSRSELLALARAVAQMAVDHDEDGAMRAPTQSAVGSAKDPLVRSLATLGLRDLLKEFSYRQLGEMFNVSHARVHQLAQDLGVADPDAAPESVPEALRKKA